MQYSQIQELVLSKFKLCHNVAEETRNIYHAKSEGTIDHSTVTRKFKNFHSGRKNLNNQAR